MNYHKNVGVNKMVNDCLLAVLLLSPLIIPCIILYSQECIYKWKVKKVASYIEGFSDKRLMSWYKYLLKKQNTSITLKSKSLKITVNAGDWFYLLLLEKKKRGLL